MRGSRASARPMRTRSRAALTPESAAVVQPVAEVAVAVLVPAAPLVHGGDELDEAPVGEVDAGGHVHDGATQFGGIVWDEVELRGVFEDGVVGVFGHELVVLDGFFVGLEHRLDPSG